MAGGFWGYLMAFGGAGQLHVPSRRQSWGPPGIQPFKRVAAAGAQAPRATYTHARALTPASVPCVSHPPAPTQAAVRLAFKVPALAAHPVEELKERMEMLQTVGRDIATRALHLLPDTWVKPPRSRSCTPCSVSHADCLGSCGKVLCRPKPLSCAQWPRAKHGSHAPTPPSNALCITAQCSCWVLTPALPGPFPSGSRHSSRARRRAWRPRCVACLSAGQLMDRVESRLN